ncbi:MAG: hypothetical protein J6A15_04915 [Clostridia bacterium]|nr:hypothetical protein [Clostridia bacterium]
MDNAQKAIMIGVGLFITILIIAAVMLMVNIGLDLMGDATDRMVSLSDALVSQLTVEYDDRVVTGSKLISAVKLYSGDMVLEVKATNGADYLEYGKARGNGTLELDKALEYDSENVQSKVSKLTDSSDTTNYVPNSARYRAELIRSTSGDVVLGIRFTREN